MKRPNVTKRKGTVGETVIEFMFPDGKGGLIAFRDWDSPDGPTIDIYRTDGGIRVLVPVNAGPSTVLVTGPDPYADAVKRVSQWPTAQEGQ